MIKFFRHIRKKLISENKFTKYLIYAVGEIILVVIGILIALWINNINEDNKSNEKERLALAEIVSDLEYSIHDLNKTKNEGKYSTIKSIESLETLIEVMEKKEPYRDSLGVYFDVAFSYDEADFKISGYNSLSSIGTDLVQNPAIRSSIGEFYTSIIPDYEEAYDEIRQDFHEYMLDYLRKDFINQDEEPSKRLIVPNDFENLKNDTEFIQSLRTFLDVKKYYVNKLNLTLDQADLLKSYIESYIND